MLQYVAVCFSVLQSVAVCCGVLQCVAVCCSDPCGGILLCSSSRQKAAATQLSYVRSVITLDHIASHHVAVRCSMLQYVAVCCSMLQYVTVCCSMLQYVAVCCSVLRCDAAVARAFSSNQIPSDHVAVCCGVLRSVAMCCGVLQCVAVTRVLYSASLSSGRKLLLCGCRVCVQRLP